ncbi:hypothetical protein NDU88_004290 [Pleurodeles waltl]|uniref:Uncharacterized protein n=1 Tax=Pleurodeles waltl TaxID=8319 RepID=A0AAV7UGQ1_PLEWA|nr:hypothetical protein NDU88_004290 [Pleurodeles waltl]
MESPLPESPIKSNIDPSASLDMILQRLCALHDLVQDTKANTDAMHHDLQALWNKFQTMAGRIIEAETRISVLEDSASTPKSKVDAATIKIKTLMKDISDLEDRNWRGNLCIFGLIERVEDNAKLCVEFLESWLPRTLGIRDIFKSP